MFGTEFYKIISRKITWICSIIIILFIFLWFQMSVAGSEVYVGEGKAYVNTKAIQKNKDLAAEYTGQLTIEKVQQIWQKYGLVPDISNVDIHINLENETADDGYYVNCLNEFVERHFFLGDYSGEDLTYQMLPYEYVERYFEPGLYFGYIGGWDWYWDGFLLLFILISVLIIIALSPVFSEEYSLRTADVILTTSNGRSKLFWCKTGASLCFAGIVYWVGFGFQFLLFLGAYGSEGLRVSTLYTSIFNWYNTFPLWVSILTILLCGWAAVTALALMALAVSAVSRQSFHSVLWSFIFFLAPAAVNIIFLQQMRSTFVVRILRLLMGNLPFLYTARFLGSTWIPRMLGSCILLVFAIVSLTGGRRNYCRHQII